MAFLGADSPAAFNGLTWTSQSKNTDRYDTITGAIFSSHAGTLHVEQSIDGTNWDIDDTVAVTASTGTKVNIAMLCPFVRLRFVATATQPTTFRLSTKLSAAGDS